MSHTKERAFTLEGEAVLSRNTGKTLAKLEGEAMLSRTHENTSLAGGRSCAEPNT